MQQRSVIGGVYQVGQVIASGPLFTIYSAYNRNSGDVVGLDVIELPPLMMSEESVTRLLQPLERRKQVLSPHVLRVYDWGIDDRRAYIVTDPPRGITLRHVLDAENVDLARALDIAQQAARGLVALQAQGVVDTDLRPQMITVDRIGDTDRVQLDDIGLRRLLRQLGYVDTQQSDDIGFLDPRYLSPESINNGQPGAWSDVYQLGLLLYEIVAGRLPFVGRNPVETGILQSSSSIPSMQQYKQDVPSSLQSLIERALAKDPAQRFPHAEALLRALESLPGVGRLAANNAALTPPAGSLPALQSARLTTEMAKLPPETDIALSDTLIDSTLNAGRRDSPANTGDEGALAYLCLEQEDGQTLRFPIKTNYVIVGRLDPKRGLTPEIDLSAVDPRMTVSRQHARIRFEKTFFYIEDLKSRNKTRLGDLTLLPMKAELLQHGDVVHFGSVRMVFRVPGMKDVPPL